MNITSIKPPANSWTREIEIRPNSEADGREDASMRHTAREVKAETLGFIDFFHIRDNNPEDLDKREGFVHLHEQMPYPHDPMDKSQTVSGTYEMGDGNGGRLEMTTSNGGTLVAEKTNGRLEARLDRKSHHNDRYGDTAEYVHDKQNGTLTYTHQYENLGD